MSDIGQPIEVFLTPEERDTVVGALRFWQAITQGDEVAFKQLMEIPGIKGDMGKWGGLENAEIDVLCRLLGQGDFL